MANKNVPSFAVDLGQAPTPVTADPSLAMQAISTKGAATRSLVEFAGKQGWDAYTGKKQADFEKEVHAVISDTYNPETGWAGIGASAELQRRANQQQDMLTETATFGGILEAEKGPPSPEADKELQLSKERLQTIMSAREQRVLSPDQARSHIGKLLRENIAALPGLADQFRQQARDITGLAGLDVADTQKVLVTDGEAAKRARADQDKMNDKMAEEIFARALGNGMGLTNLLDIKHHVANRTQEGSQMLFMLQAQKQGENYKNELKTMEDTGELASKQGLRKYNNTAMSAMLWDEGATIQKQSGAWKQAGFDVVAKNASNLAPSEVDMLLTWNRAQADDSIRRINGYITGLQQQQAANPNIRAEDVAESIKLFEDQIKRMEERAKLPASAVLQQFKDYTLRANESAQHLLTIAQTQDTVLKIGWGQNMVDMMRDPRTREGVVKQYAGNKGVEALARTIAARQAGTFGDMADIEKWRRTQRVSEGLFNPNASPEDKAAAATSTPEEQADARQLVHAEGGDVLKNGSAVEDKQINAAFGTGSTFDRTGKSLDDVHASVISGKYEDAFRNDTTRIPAFRKAVGERAEFWLSPMSPRSLPQLLKDLGDKLPKEITLVEKGGKLSYTTADGSSIYSHGALNTLAEADKIVGEANKMLEIQASLGVDASKRAKQLMTDINYSKTSKGAVDSVLSMSPDYMKPNDTSFKVSGGSMVGKSREAQIAMLKQQGVPAMYHEAILKDLNK